MSGFLENLENSLDFDNIEFESKVSQYMLDMFAQSQCECGKCQCSS